MKNNKQLKLTQAELAKFKEISAKVKAGTATDAEKKEGEQLAGKIQAYKKMHSSQKFKKSKGSNHFPWYTKYPNLIKDAANVIFNEIAGTEFTAPSKATFNNIRYPVVGARISILPTIGKNTKANDPFNYQMRDLWLKLHRAYRGIGTYEYADLGIAIYSIMMAFTDIARAERIYGACSLFHARNRSYPLALLHALHIDTSNIGQYQLADFRYQINRAIEKARILCLPKGLTSFELYNALFSNVFKDSEDIRAQWFLYDSDYLLNYDATFSTGSSITYSRRTMTGNSNTQTLDDIIKDINVQLDNLLSDTDIARMCSDILKAFGDNGVESLNPLPADYTLEILKDDIRTLQLHNTTLVAAVAGGGFSSAILTAFGTINNVYDTLRIYQEAGVVKHSLYAYDDTYNYITPAAITTANYIDFGGEYVPSLGTTIGRSFAPGDVPLNTFSRDVTDEDIVEITRQAVPVTLRQSISGGNSYDAIELDNYGIYVVQSIQMYSNASSGTNAGRIDTNIMTYGGLPTLNAALLVVASASVLDWAPAIRLVFDNSGTLLQESMFWDLDNYSLISKQALSRLHDACNLSVFELSLNTIRD